MPAPLRAECLCCKSDNTKVHSTRRRYLKIDNKDEMPQRRVIRCDDCGAQWEELLIGTLRKLISGSLTETGNGRSS